MKNWISAIFCCEICKDSFDSGYTETKLPASQLWSRYSLQIKSIKYIRAMRCVHFQFSQWISKHLLSKSLEERLYATFGALQWIFDTYPTLWSCLKRIAHIWKSNSRYIFKHITNIRINSNYSYKFCDKTHLYIYIYIRLLKKISKYYIYETSKK